MPRTICLFVLLSAFLLAGSSFLAPAASAQDQQEGEPALPDIAPREIEIRGTLEISLPSLERQPLSGFNPPPRIPDIPAGRSPHIGDYEQAQSDLPLQMPEPPALQAQLDQPAPPLTGELEAGGGRYFTRFANGQIWIPVSTHESFTLAGDYRGSSGFEPFADAPDIDTPFDTFEADFGFESRRDGFSLNAGLEGFFDTYTLYGAQVDPTSSFTPSPFAQPERTGHHVQGALDLRTHGPVSLHLFGRAGGTNYETTVSADTTDGGSPQVSDDPVAERRIQAGGGLTVPVGISQATFDATFETAGLNPEGQFGNDIITLDGGLGAELLTDPELRLEVGGRFLLASIGPDSRPNLTERQAARFLVPSFSLDWTLSPSTTLYAHNQPGVDTHPLADLFRENPYLFGDVAVQPSLRTTDAEGGIRIFTGPFQLVARGGYRYVVGYRYFADTPRTSASPYDAGTFIPRYASAHMAHAGAEVSLQRMQGFEVSLGASYREGRLVNDDAAIPYFAPVTGQAVLSYAFAEQKGMVQLTGRFESARPVDREESAKIDPYLDADLELSYAVTPSLGIVFELENMTSGSLEHWPRYPRPPLVFTSGLRVQW